MKTVKEKYGGVLCTNLTEIIIPEGVEIIDRSAFEDCANLINVTIPHTVTRINYGAFNNCRNLATVFYSGTEADWESIIIGNGNSSLIDTEKVYVARTTTTVSDFGKTFTIIPTNVKNGKAVILALYDGDNLIEIQYAIYEGKPILLTTNKGYTNAKVMAWENMTSLKPVCYVEIVI